MKVKYDVFNNNLCFLLGWGKFYKGCNSIKRLSKSNSFEVIYLIFWFYFFLFIKFLVWIDLNLFGKCMLCRYKLFFYIYFMMLLIWFNYYFNLRYI